MIERFLDVMFFALIGFVVTLALASLVTIAAGVMTFADRWVDLPPAIVLPAKKSLPEVPIYFCARYVSTTRCRIA